MSELIHVPNITSGQNTKMLRYYDVLMSVLEMNVILCVAYHQLIIAITSDVLIVTKFVPKKLNIYVKVTLLLIRLLSRSKFFMHKEGGFSPRCLTIIINQQTKVIIWEWACECNNQRSF